MSRFISTDLCLNFRQELGWVSLTPAGNLVQGTDVSSVKAYEKFRLKMVKLSDSVFTYDFAIYFAEKKLEQNIAKRFFP